jgi:hypothetical protein
VLTYSKTKVLTTKKSFNFKRKRHVSPVKDGIAEVRRRVILKENAFLLKYKNKPKYLTCACKFNCAAEDRRGYPLVECESDFSYEFSYNYSYKFKYLFNYKFKYTYTFFNLQKIKLSTYKFIINFLFLFLLLKNKIRKLIT